MAKRGAPSKKTPEVEDTILECVKLGMTDAEICDIIKISDRTLDRWKAKNDAFCRALKVEKWKHDQEVVSSLRKSAKGFHMEEEVAHKDGPMTIKKYHAPNATSAIFWLKNRQPKAWRDKVEIETEAKGIIQVIADGTKTSFDT